MPALNAQEVEKAIDQLFEHMQKMGFEMSQDHKDTIRKEMGQALHNQLEGSDIKDIQVQKKLMSCIVAMVMGDEKTFNATLDGLKSDNKKQNDPQFNFQLKVQLALLAAVLELKEKNELTPSALRKKLMENLLKPQPKPGNKKDETLEEKQESDFEKDMAETLRNLYGGVDPTKTGGLAFPITGPIVGNAFGFTNQCAADPTSMAKMVDLITYNVGKPDPNGLENVSRLAALEEGPVDMGIVFSPSLHR